MTNVSLLSNRSLVLAETDPHLVSAYVNRHVDAHRIIAPRNQNRKASLWHRSCDKLELCRVRYGDGRVRVHAETLASSYHLQVLLYGNCLLRNRDGETWVSSADVIVLNPDDAVDLTHSDDCEKFIVKIPVAFIDQLCVENRWQRPAAGIRFDSKHSAIHLHGIKPLLELVCTELEHDSGVSVLQRHYARIVAVKLFELLQPDVRRELLGEVRPSFERLAEYIEGHLGHEIGIEQLATMANLSRRALYDLFESSVGLSPRQYIRRRRLARVRTALLEPASGVRNVTEIALECGFSHLGRFADCYRQEFGELPSQTLCRSGALSAHRG